MPDSNLQQLRSNPRPLGLQRLPVSLPPWLYSRRADVLPAGDALPSGLGAEDH
jgi:hypothetical protein